jgi:hypothetical protein
MFVIVNAEGHFWDGASFVESRDRGAVIYHSLKAAARQLMELETYGPLRIAPLFDRPVQSSSSAALERPRRCKSA